MKKSCGPIFGMIEKKTTNQRLVALPPIRSVAIRIHRIVKKAKF